jgi:hypothetical protein
VEVQHHQIKHLRRPLILLVEMEVVLFSIQLLLLAVAVAVHTTVQMGEVVVLVVEVAGEIVDLAQQVLVIHLQHLHHKETMEELEQVQVQFLAVQAVEADLVEQEQMDHHQHLVVMAEVVQHHP